MIGAGGNWAWATSDASECSFPLVGDLHFDRLEHHDHEWLAREYPNDVSQVQNYSRITSELTPKLLDRVRVTCRQLAAAKANVPFVLQLGDLLEGLCGTNALAAQQAREGVEFLRSAQSDVPWVMTKGNHDVTGPGATEAYEQVLLPFLSRETKSEITRPAFSQTHGGTLFAFYDAYDRRSLDWFAKLLEESKPRRLIVAIHPPVVPYNARSSWHVYSSPKQQTERQRLLELLGRHRAIVLCGHLHKYSFLVRRTEHGRFSQLALSSVASTADGRPRDVLEGVLHYNADLVDLEPRHSPDTLAQRRANLAAEQPFIEHFEYADTWGHAVVHLGAKDAAAEVYRGFEEQSSKKLDLTRA